VDSFAQRPWFRRWFGDRSEEAAARFLGGLGYRILERNYRSHQGELDMIALDGDCLVFVEVRSTERDSDERPALSIDVVKQRRLTQLALSYLQQHRLLGHAARFDVVTVSWPPTQRKPAITHYPNAFEPSDRFQMWS